MYHADDGEPGQLAIMMECLGSLILVAEEEEELGNLAGWYSHLGEGDKEEEEEE